MGQGVAYNVNFLRKNFKNKIKKTVDTKKTL